MKELVLQYIGRLFSYMRRFAKNARQHKTRALLVFFLVFIGVFAYGPVAFAQDLGIANPFVTAISQLMVTIARLFVGLTIFALRFFIELAKYNNYVNTPTVIAGWFLVRDVVNMFFVVVLLVIAFGTILGIEQYEWKKTLVNFLLAAIFVNFSKLIAGLIIDAAHVFTITFLNAISAAAGGNLINMFHLGSLFSFVNSNGGGVFEQYGSLTLELFAGSVIVVIFAAIAMVTMGAYLMVMMARVVVLWMLIILSPLAFILQVLPATKSFAQEWWREFGKHVVVAPLMVFFLWLAFSTLGSGNFVEKDLGITVNNQQLQEVKAVFNFDELEQNNISIAQISTWEVMSNFLIATAFLILGLKVVGRMSVTAGGFTQSAINFGKNVATIAAGVRLAQWAGRKTADVAESSAKLAGKGAAGLGYVVAGEKIATKAKTQWEAWKGQYWDNAGRTTAQGDKIKEEITDLETLKADISSGGATALTSQIQKLEETREKEAAIANSSDPEITPEKKAEAQKRMAEIDQEIGDRQGRLDRVRKAKDDGESVEAIDKKIASKDKELQNEFIAGKMFSPTAFLARRARANIQRHKALAKTEKQTEYRKKLLWKSVGSEAGGEAVFKGMLGGMGTKGILGTGLFGDKYKRDRKMYVRDENGKLVRAREKGEEVLTLGSRLFGGTETKMKKGKKISQEYEGSEAQDRIERGWYAAEEQRSAAKDEEYETLGEMRALASPRKKYDVNKGIWTYESGKSNMVERIQDRKLRGQQYRSAIEGLEAEARLRVVADFDARVKRRGGIDNQFKALADKLNKIGDSFTLGNLEKQIKHAKEQLLGMDKIIANDDAMTAQFGSDTEKKQAYIAQRDRLQGQLAELQRQEKGARAYGAQKQLVEIEKIMNDPSYDRLTDAEKQKLQSQRAEAQTVLHTNGGEDEAEKFTQFLEDQKTELSTRQSQLAHLQGEKQTSSESVVASRAEQAALQREAHVLLVNDPQLSNKGNKNRFDEIIKQIGALHTRELMADIQIKGISLVGEGSFDERIQRAQEKIRNAQVVQKNAGGPDAQDAQNKATYANAKTEELFYANERDALQKMQRNFVNPRYYEKKLKENEDARKQAEQLPQETDKQKTERSNTLKALDDAKAELLARKQFASDFAQPFELREALVKQIATATQKGDTQKAQALNKQLEGANLQLNNAVVTVGTNEKIAKQSEQVAKQAERVARLDHPEAGTAIGAEIAAIVRRLSGTQDPKRRAELQEEVAQKERDRGILLGATSDDLNRRAAAKAHKEALVAKEQAKIKEKMTALQAERKQTERSKVKSVNYAQYDDYVKTVARTKLRKEILESYEGRLLDDEMKQMYADGVDFDALVVKLNQGRYHTDTEDLRGQGDQIDQEIARLRRIKFGGLDDQLKNLRSQYAEKTSELNKLQAPLQAIKRELQELNEKRLRISSDKEGATPIEGKEEMHALLSNEIDVKRAILDQKKSELLEVTAEPRKEAERIKQQIVEVNEQVSSKDRELQKQDPYYQELMQKKVANKQALEEAGGSDSSIAKLADAVRAGDKNALGEVIRTIKSNIAAETSKAPSERDEVKINGLQRDLAKWEDFAAGGFKKFRHAALAWQYGVAKGLQADLAKGLSYQHNLLLSQAEQRAVHDDRGLDTPVNTLTEIIEDYSKAFSEMSSDSFIANVGPMLKKMLRKNQEGSITQQDRAALMGLFKRGFDRAWIDDAISGILADEESKTLIADQLGWQDEEYTDEKIRDIQMLFATGANVEFVKKSGVITDVADLATSEFGMDQEGVLKAMSTGKFVDATGKDVTKQLRDAMVVDLQKRNVTYTDDKKKMLKAFFADSFDSDFQKDFEKFDEEKKSQYARYFGDVITQDAREFKQMQGYRKSLLNSWMNEVEERQSELQFLGNLRPEALANGHAENAGWALGRKVGSGTLYIPMGLRTASNHVMGDARKMDVRTRAKMQSHSFSYLDEKNGQVLTRIKEDRYADIFNGVDGNTISSVNARARVHMVGLGGNDKTTDFRDENGAFHAAKITDDFGNLTSAGKTWTSKLGREDTAFGRRYRSAASAEEKEAAVASAMMEEIFAPQMRGSLQTFTMLAADAAGIPPREASQSGQINFKIYDPATGGLKVFPNIQDLVSAYNAGHWSLDGNPPVRKAPNFVPSGSGKGKTNNDLYSTQDDDT